MNRFAYAMFCWLGVTAVALCGCDARGPITIADTGGGGGDTGMGGDGGITDTGTVMPPSSIAPGAACNCDSECEGDATHPGLCVQGVCMTRASADCASAGSSGECLPGSRCWGLEGFTGGICWPDCSSYSCAGSCDGDGSCVASESTTCNASCSEVCTDTTPGSCPPSSHMEGDGCVCDAGFHVNAAGTGCDPDGPPIDIGTPPPGPPPACAIGSGGIPDWRCTGSASHCGELVPFTPVMGPGYDNYPLNGETASDQYRSYVRRDVMMLVKYASAMVACQSAGWTFGLPGVPLGLGDMSESNGAIPGTRDGSPGHPAGTHTDGHDMDIAYYQTGTSDNRLRAICPHTSGGADQYHCTGAPNLLDPWRTAAFLGHLHVSPQLRVIGVDGQAGPIIDSALTQLCSGGWLSGAACSGAAITYETTDMGRGWYRFHHHHFHISVSSP